MKTVVDNIKLIPNKKNNRYSKFRWSNPPKSKGVPKRQTFMYTNISQEFPLKFDYL